MRLGLLVLSCVCSCCFVACGGDDGGGGSGGGGGGSGASGGGGATGGGGTGATGGLPSGPCVPTAEECYGAGPTGPGAECLAKADNSSASKWQGRLTSILVKAPASLAGAFVQEQVIDKGISLDQPSCYEGGDGTFSWLYEIDPTAKTMKTGGSLPIGADPKVGGCFVTMTTTALKIAPITVPVTIEANNTSWSAQDIDVNVPIFLSATDTKNPIILPLHKVKLIAKFNDATHNCIGKFNGDQLDPINSCLPDTKAIPPQRSWTTGGTLEGYITVAEADQVMVAELGATLCVLLAGLDWKGPDKDCKSSTKWQSGERPAGDWCSATNDASCAQKDSYLLKGDFAAAAFKINGECA